ncbi:MAG: aldo/keto reductase [Nitrospinota bacterium]|nr:aldo/keto reductase [Nitrospinota bacterium]
MLAAETLGKKIMVPARILGKTGESISTLGFGTAPAGTRLNLKNAVRLYEEALNLGVNYFDTAPEFAGYGNAQKQLGFLLKNRRKEVFLVTKCYEPKGDAALKLLQRNLRELQTDYADLVFVHSVGADKMDPKIVFGPQGCYAALMKTKAAGLTRFVGFSGHNRPGRFVEALKNFKVDVLLNAVNFADQHTYNFEKQVWPLARKIRTGLIAMKVFGGQVKEQQARLSNSLMPKEYLEAAFRYALSQPGVASAVIGMATSAELQQNIKWARNFKPLAPRETAQLRTIGRRLSERWGSHLGPLYE